MRMLAERIEAKKHLLRLTVGMKPDGKQAGSVNQDEFVLARIARMYPELIMIASESKDCRR